MSRYILWRTAISDDIDGMGLHAVMFVARMGITSLKDPLFTQASIAVSESFTILWSDENLSVHVLMLAFEWHWQG